MRGLFGHGAGLALAAASLVGLGSQVVPAPEPERPRKRSRPVRHYRRSGSLAGQPHEHKREIARRLKQMARNAERQRARQVAKNGPDSPFPGISRRGNFVAWPDGSPAKAR